MKANLQLLLIMLIGFNVQADLTCVSLAGDSSNVESEKNNPKLGREATSGRVQNYFKKYKSSNEYNKGRVPHGLMAQTSWLTGKTFNQLSKLQKELDMTDISEDPAAPAIVLQTILLSSSTEEEVIYYFRNFPDIDGLSKGTPGSLILIQTAFLSEKDPQDVVEFFHDLPGKTYNRKDMAFFVMAQSALFGHLEEPATINNHFRELRPYLFANISKGFIALAIQTEFFARRFHLE